ncbi:thiol-activated cytolysin family protein [Sorangium sp. So ce131]|uniref:thiol-activated cytolysin family protein n=1 Tax=Sorangium sp. So ce131 TaxID=3133282 RepID=UPI003F612B8F
MRHHRSILRTCAFIILPLLAACFAPEGADEAGGEGAPELGVGEAQQAIGNTPREEGINEIIYNTADITATPEEQTELGDWSSFEYRNTGTFKCTYREVDEVKNTDEISAYSPNAGVLFPGAIIQGDSVESGILELVGLPRSGGTVAVNSINIAPGSTPPLFSRAVSVFNSGNVDSAVAQIFQAAGAGGTFTAADFQYEVEDVRKLDETLLEAGVDAEWAKAKLGLDFSLSESHTRTDLYVYFRQKFYTVSVQDWENPNKALKFADSVKPEEAALTMSPRNPPAYIQNVSYGRMLIMRIRSNADESTVKLALNAQFEQNGGQFGVNLGFEQRQLLSQSSLKVAALGGNPTLAMAVMAPGNSSDVMTALQTYLNQGAQWSPSNPGLPLSYKVNHLATDNVLKLAYASRYTVPDCHLSADKLRVTLERIDVVNDGDNIGKGDFKYGFGVSRTDTSGGLNTTGDTYKRANGEQIHIGRFEDILVEQREGNCFNVRIKVNEYDDGFNSVHTSLYPHDPELRYCFNAGRNIWELNRSLPKEGDTNILEMVGGPVKVNVRFSVSRVNDCPSGFVSDGTVCVVPSAFAINKDARNEVTACYDDAIMIDARNLYATSSHVQRAQDHFFVEVGRTSADMAAWYEGANQWIPMGQNFPFLLENRVNLAGFLSYHGLSLQPNAYYSVKLAADPWNETRKRLFVRGRQSSFTINDSASATVGVAHDGDILLNGADSCTAGNVYTLTVQGPGGALAQGALGAAEVKDLGKLDVRAFAKQRGLELVPGNTYSVSLAVSSGHTQTKSVAISACPSFTKWNGSECVTAMDTSVWDADNDNCLVRTGPGTVGVASCAGSLPSFELLPFGDNLVRLQFLGTSECLAAADFTNAPAVTRPCGYGDKGLFEVVQLGGGVVQLVNADSGQCVSFQPSGSAMLTSCTNTEPTRVKFDWERGTAVVSNLATGATVTAQSTFGGYSAARINDGDRSTALGGATSWANLSASSPGGGLPQWVDLNFGAPRTFSQVRVYTTASYPIRDYDLQSWNGTSWQTILAVTGNTQALRTDTFPAVTSDRLRVLCRRGPDAQPVYARLNEVEVY